MSDVEAQKPALVIDLVGPEGNVFALVAKAWQTLEQAGHGEQAMALRTWFRELVPSGERVSYDDVRRMVEQYCEVTWVNGNPPPAAQLDHSLE